MSFSKVYIKLKKLGKALTHIKTFKIFILITQLSVDRSSDYFHCEMQACLHTNVMAMESDLEALESRKEHKPKSSAVGMAFEMGDESLTEEKYRELQQLGNFDTKTLSWMTAPAEIRKLGGALFCDRRYNQFFLYHNGAESYYAARAFHGSLRV